MVPSAVTSIAYESFRECPVGNVVPHATHIKFSDVVFFTALDTTGPSLVMDYRKVALTILTAIAILRK